MDETIIALYSENDLCNAMGARLVNSNGFSFKSVSTDSRKVTKDDLFIALSGEHFDAHDFIPDVIQKGCRGILVSREIDVPKDVSMFIVPDVLKAFGMLAKSILEKRRKLGNFTTYAVTGSNGKTTTKELLTLLLTALGNSVLKTEGNFNNFIGLPITVLNLRTSHTAAVLEMGANAPGEIEYLSSIGQPDTAIITCIGSAHLHGFGSIEGVANAKGEMIYAPRLKKIVLPAETRKYYQTRIPESVTPIWVGNETSNESIRFEHIVPTLDAIQFDINTNEDSLHVELPLLGTHNAENLTRAYAAVLPQKLSAEQMNNAIAQIRLPSGRLERWVGEKGTSFLHDAYNANPSSMAEALKLIALYQAPKCLILGDMRELGPQSDDFHYELGKNAARINPLKLLCVGDSAQHIQKGAVENGLDCTRVFCTSSDSLQSGLEWLKSALSNDTICLIKGSRGVKLERVLDFFNAVRK